MYNINTERNNTLDHMARALVRYSQKAPSPEIWLSAFNELCERAELYGHTYSSNLLARVKQYSDDGTECRRPTPEWARNLISDLSDLSECAHHG